MKISKRVCSMPFSATRKLMPYAEKAKIRGKKIYPLNIGQPDIKTPKEFFEAIKEFDEEVLAYGKSNGNIDLIEKMVSYYKKCGIKFEKEDIVITAGASEALLFAMLATCDVGDSIIIPEPFYTDYNLLSKELNVEIIPITTKAENGYHLPNKEEILAKTKETTRAILINNPNNPTGAVYTKEEVEMIVEIALEKNLFIIADEVYREFIYGDVEFNSFAEYDKAKNNVILVDSVSKRYSACGARIGCFASRNRELMKEVTKLCQSRLCSSTLDQVGAIKLYETPMSYFEEVNQEYKRRRDVVYTALKKMKGVVCEEPIGAFYVAMKLPVDNAEKFLIWLLEEFDYEGETIAMAALEGFYATEGLGTKEVRIAYILKEEDLARCMIILEKALLEYPGREI